MLVLTRLPLALLACGLLAPRALCYGSLMRREASVAPASALAAVEDRAMRGPETVSGSLAMSSTPAFVPESSAAMAAAASSAVASHYSLAVASTTTASTEAFLAANNSAWADFLATAGAIMSSTGPTAGGPSSTTPVSPRMSTTTVTKGRPISSTTSTSASMSRPAVAPMTATATTAAYKMPKPTADLATTTVLMASASTLAAVDVDGSLQTDVASASLTTSSTTAAATGSSTVAPAASSSAVIPRISLATATTTVESSSISPTANESTTRPSVRLAAADEAAASRATAIAAMSPTKARSFSSATPTSSVKWTTVVSRAATTSAGALTTGTTSTPASKAVTETATTPTTTLSKPTTATTATVAPTNEGDAVDCATAREATVVTTTSSPASVAFGTMQAVPLFTVSAAPPKSVDRGLAWRILKRQLPRVPQLEQHRHGRTGGVEPVFHFPHVLARRQSHHLYRGSARRRMPGGDVYRPHFAGSEQQKHYFLDEDPHLRSGGGIGGAIIGGHADHVAIPEAHATEAKIPPAPLGVEYFTPLPSPPPPWGDSYAAAAAAVTEPPPIWRGAEAEGDWRYALPR
eukprot:TRINITY_DN15983_c0_g1_i1.p1 TRINITY_DN15983_c0_g1~~TRINITY_DN15983_c0_g1_i1.p1  ORF type:complete len:579 (+),score=100.00 TRINITY_DN15983_c0_g1_i1:449-2185(+)